MRVSERDGDADGARPSPALARVAAGNLCAGCGACAGVGKNVSMDGRSGFLRPIQSGPVSPTEEADIAAACPGLRLDLQHDAPVDDVLWGPVRRVAAASAADQALRHEAASGGALSATLVHLLETGAVDFIVQIAADPDNPIGNSTVVSRTAAEVFAASGSRYAPSAPLENIRKIADAATAAGETGAFVGKPCDVAALRALAARDDDLRRAFPYVLSFFCAGVPNLAGARAVVEALGFDPDDVETFRYRGRGWPGEAAATTRDGRRAAMTYIESWGAILSRHVQFRCKICPDGIGSFADIAFGDAWESDARGYPKFDDLPGQSLVVARTAVGAALLEAAEAAGALSTTPMELRDVDVIQKGQRHRRGVLSARLTALGLMGRPRPRYLGFHLKAAARRMPKGERVRNFFGIIRRQLAG